MKKLKIAAVVALAVLVECAGIAFAVKHFPWRKNERILLSLMHEFKGVVSEHADIVEDQSVYGKLIGNGNGIQYFGCVLILKDSLKDEKALMERSSGSGLRAWAAADRRVRRFRKSIWSTAGCSMIRRSMTGRLT